MLWDVDYTLVDSDGVGRMLYEIAFRELFGAQMPQPGLMSGRTDRAIALEVLTLAGLPEPQRLIGPFQAAQATHAAELADAVRAHGRALPGAGAALAALARPGAAWGPRIVQALLTGNIRPLAEVKLGPLGLLDHLDLEAGAYGDVHEVRAELVHAARRNAGRIYAGDFAGEATVLVGDTPWDIEAALATGARAVGVATGGFDVAQLAAAGAHAVLPDLTDTSKVLAAILADPVAVTSPPAG